MSDDQDKPLLADFDLEKVEGLIGNSNGIWAHSLRNMLKMRAAERGACPGKTIYQSHEELIEMILGYFKYIEGNPLEEDSVFAYQGETFHDARAKMRAPTTAGLCAWLCISRETWTQWRGGSRRPEFKPVVEWVDQMMYDIKYTGASAGLLNPMIVARDLGLAEKQDINAATKVVIQGDEANL